MLMSSSTFVHGHGITQISVFCSNIIRKISRGPEEDSWPHEESEENVHFDMYEFVCMKYIMQCYAFLFAQCWRKVTHHC